MNHSSRLLSVGSAVFLLALPLSAQLGAPQPGTGIVGPVLTSGMAGRSSYDHHWAPMHGSPTASWSGAALWDPFSSQLGFNPFSKFGGPGDSIRICYGIDATQGGRNWTGPGSTTPGPFGLPADLHAGGGQTENTWFRIVQGFASIALGTPQAGVEIGLISVQAGTSSDIAADNCFTPFNKGAPNSGLHQVGAVAVGGLFTGTGIAAAPGIFWEFSFSWGPTPALLSNHLGDDLLDPGVPSLPIPIPPRGIGNPLLSNVIFEVQAPLDGVALGFLGNQYYLSSTIEWAGVQSNSADPVLGIRGSGGVTNGNSNWGFGIFGVPAGVSNTVSASRFMRLGSTSALLLLSFRVQTPLVQKGSTQAGTAVLRSGRIEFLNSLAFSTPRSWAYHNFNSALGSKENTGVSGPGHLGAPGGAGAAQIVEGRDGSNGFELFVGNGGPDWRISSAPISNVDVIAIDHQSGADANFNVYNKVGTYASPTTMPGGTNLPTGPYAHAAAGFNTTNGTNGYYNGIPGVPCFIPQFNRMLMLWSATPSGAPMIQVPGSWDNSGPFDGIQGTVGSSSPTTREGFQSTSINFDSTTTLLVGKAALLFGTRFSDSDDFFADGALDYGGNILPSFSSVFEGGIVPMSSGQSDMKPNGGQIPIAVPSPSLAGVALYLSLAGTHIDLCNGGAFEITEQYNALTIVLQ